MRSSTNDEPGMHLPADSSALVERPSIGVSLMLDRAEKDDHVARYGMNRTYFTAIRAAGGIPIPIAPGDPAEMDRYIGSAAVSVGGGAGRGRPFNLDGLCLTGGGDLDPRHYGQQRRPGCNEPDAERDEMELALLRSALAQELPLFAICRGIQVLNAFLGGTLLQDIGRERPGGLDHAHRPGQPRDRIVHDIHVERGSRLHEILGAPVVPVNSLHHQAADDVAPGLVVTARAPDGIIEGLERPAEAGGLAGEIERGRFLMAVQFHPEDLQGREEMRALFGFFVAAARRRRALCRD
ncbi:MAG: gamma-glutamyl-gamma-aminobutyrate hydrolase family protein [Candidatus Eisenbacteria bacterium]